MIGATIFIVFLAVVFVSIPWPASKPDPMDLPAKPIKRPEPFPTEPAINLYVKDERWLNRYKAQVALGGSPNSLTDQRVMQTVDEIVNGAGLSKQAKHHMLDALQMRVWNDHPHGVAARVIETINDEMEALEYPHWHGRYGTFTSVNRQSKG